VALPVTSFSLACASVAEFVRGSLGGDEVIVLVGSPADAVPQGAQGKHHLNLFFHRLEPAGFFPDATPRDPWRVRVHCLVTPFALADGEASAGENDLRLLGAVLRLFATTPLLPEFEAEGQQFRLHAVFQPMSLDDVNRLWTTQRDLSLRPSVAYEIALVPVLPHTAAEVAQLVGSVRLDVSAARQPGLPPPAPIRRPPFTLRAADFSAEAWRPQLAFGAPAGWARVLDVDAGPGAAGASAEVGIAGRAGELLSLRWDVWHHGTGWSPGPAETQAVPTFEMFPPTPAGAKVKTVPLPFTDRPGQAVLRACRTCVRRSDDAPLEVLSDPLLVVVRGGTP